MAALVLMAPPAAGCAAWSLGVPGPTSFSVLALPADSLVWRSLDREGMPPPDPEVVVLVSGDALLLLPGLDPPGTGAGDLPPLRPPPGAEAPILRDTLATLGGAPLYLVAARLRRGEPVEEEARRLLVRIADRAPPGAIVVAVVALADAMPPGSGATFDRLVGGYLQGWGSCPGTPPEGAPGPLRVYYAPVALVECTGADSFHGGPDARVSGPLIRLRSRN